MHDYYSLLGITPFSSVSEIKHAFRKKAKEFHPDLQREPNRLEYNTKMTELLIAYRYAIQHHKNIADNEIFENKVVREFNYRQWLVEQETYESSAKLIVFDLFHENEKSAVEEYVRVLQLDRPFYFSKYFSREDFMDYGFVLAEELFFEKHYYESFFLLKDIIAYETERPYFTHFFPEVISLTKKVLDSLSIKNTNIEKIIECYTHALELNLPSRQKKTLRLKLEKLMAD